MYFTIKSYTDWSRISKLTDPNMIKNFNFVFSDMILCLLKTSKRLNKWNKATQVHCLHAFCIILISYAFNNGNTIIPPLGNGHVHEFQPPMLQIENLEKCFFGNNFWKTIYFLIKFSHYVYFGITTRWV